MSEERDWSNLPPELIFLISRKLADLSDFIRFHAVWKTWLSSVPFSDHPPQIPWLLEYDADFSVKACMKEELHFYSLTSHGTKTKSIPIKESHHNKKYNRNAHGYLLVEDGNELSLLNPLTDKEISIPAVQSDSKIEWPIFMASNPIENLYTLFNHKLQKYNLGVYHPDKMEFTYVDSDFCCACYWNSMLLTTQRSCCTQMYDAISGKMLYEIPTPKNEDKVARTYLIVSCGVIFRVSLIFPPCVTIFRIYKLNFDGGKGEPCWVEVRNIGDQIFFLDSWSGFSVRAVAGLKENCIYFILTELGKFHPHNVLLRYDIATSKAERVPCPLERFMWFIPKLC
ncbi:F-box protein (DUF295) [Rhynchospora pubera]|uniref:F-box protein (DUF295) n=1 Tax=Rhynchospora pubera TaxID=906938 RepID=A0AAV8G8Z5_9POAL|nr:F-box protein (DUF295) [Rhynchospora pubera]